MFRKDPKRVLAHDLIKLRGTHAAVLHLLERPAGFNGLMLPGVANDNDALRWLDLLKKRLRVW